MPKMNHTVKYVFAMLLLSVMVCMVLPGAAFAGDPGKEALEIIHDPDTDADCLKYTEDKLLLSGMSHTFRAVVKDEYKDICSAKDVEWRVTRYKTVKEGDVFFCNKTVQGEIIIDGYKGETVTFMAESHPDPACTYNYTIEAWYWGEKSRFYAKDKDYNVFSAVFYNPGQAGINPGNQSEARKDRWLAKGQVWDLAKEKAQMITAANLSRGGELVDLGTYAQSMKFHSEEAGSSFTQNGFSITAKASTSGSFNKLSFDFGSVDTYDRTYYCAAAAERPLVFENVLDTDRDWFYYTPAGNETLYMEAKGRILCYDAYGQEVAASWDENYRKIAGTTLSIQLGQITLSGRNLYVFEIKSSHLIVNRQKPSWWDEAWGKTGTIDKSAVTETGVDSASQKTEVDTGSSVKNPAPVSGLKVKAGKKKLTLNWKKTAKDENITGFEISYKKQGSKKWTVKKVKASKNKLVLKKLKKGKKYSVRIRKYRIVKSGGKTKTVYGKYKKKTVKVK